MKSVLQLGPLPVSAATRPPPALEAVLTRHWEAPDWLSAHAGEVRVVITSSFRGMPEDLWDRLPNLGLIANLGTGLDKIDLDVARRRGVRVTHTADEVTSDVADLAIGMIVTVFRRTREAEAYLREGRWSAGPFPLGRSLSGAKLGILGLGRIGRAVALRAEACGMLTAYTGRAPKAEEPRPFHPDPVSLARWADVLLVATAGGAETRALVDAPVLEALGPQGLLVNVARGSVVDEEALVRTLADGRLGGAALDVYEDEPRPHRGLLERPDVLLLPHIGTSTAETRDAMARHVYHNALAYLIGEPLKDAAV